jgi:hypothetical protein
MGACSSSTEGTLTRTSIASYRHCLQALMPGQISGHPAAGAWLGCEVWWTMTT